MKKIQKTEQEEEERDIEILKAVAQAWHDNSSSSKATATTSEFDTHRRYFKGKPTRFKTEAMRQSTMQAAKKDNQSGTSWDFGQSLWDSYEIVSVSKKLETGLLLDNPFSALNEKGDGFKRRKESENSLRNLFNRASSR